MADGGILTRLKTLWEISGQAETVATVNEVEPFEVPEEPFVAFPCEECKEHIVVRTHIYPGQAVVRECDNCKTSWTFFAPQLTIRKTKEIPEYLQNKVWGELSQ